jgi:predicted CXXCH cytochrome family protein
VFASFVDHPEFRVHTDGLRDPNTLRFGHALHLTAATIPNLPGGQKIDCVFCHKPDATGVFFQPLRFEQNCRVCHSLQFDPETPELTLPHGQPQFLIAFLNSLGRQYADYARDQRGLRRDGDVQNFVTARLQAVQDRFGSRGELEQRVLLGNSTLAPASQVGTLSGPARAVYPGCAYCHEVKAGVNIVPRVTPGVIPDRWLTHGGFNHAKHTQVACVSCHAAAASKETADIILPSKSVCVTCHSPAGGVKYGCSICHGYHNQPPKPGLSAR